MISLPRDRMDQMVKRFDLLEAQMAAGPDPEAYVRMAGEYASLEEMAGKIRALRAAEGELADLEAMLADKATDAEMRALAEAEYTDVEERIEAMSLGRSRIWRLRVEAASSGSSVLSSSFAISEISGSFS